MFIWTIGDGQYVSALEVDGSSTSSSDPAQGARRDGNVRWSTEVYVLSELPRNLDLLILPPELE